ncbi:MAG: hypothetical protein K2Q22_13775 [Cytophagales bacterium]|nr:hypothetical protein [Cytophagales bacterium]
MIYTLNLKTGKKGLIGIYTSYKECEDAALAYISKQNYRSVKIVQSIENTGVIKIKGEIPTTPSLHSFFIPFGFRFFNTFCDNFYFKVIRNFDQ